MTAYNPNGHFTNAGNDWYFENRVVDTGGADAWLKWVSGAGANTVLTVPAYVCRFFFLCFCNPWLMLIPS